MSYSFLPAHPHWTTHCSRTAAVRCLLQTVKGFVDSAFSPRSFLSDLLPWPSRAGCVAWSLWPILPRLDPVSQDMEEVYVAWHVGLGLSGAFQGSRSALSRLVWASPPAQPGRCTPPSPPMSGEAAQGGSGELGKGPSPIHLLFPILLHADFTALTLSCSFLRKDPPRL